MGEAPTLMMAGIAVTSTHQLEQYMVLGTGKEVDA